MEDIETDVFSTTEKKIKYNSTSDTRSALLQGEGEGLKLDTNPLTQKNKVLLQEDTTITSFKMPVEEFSPEKNIKKDSELVSESFLQLETKPKNRENFGTTKPTDLGMGNIPMSTKNSMTQEFPPSKMIDESRSKEQINSKSLEFIE